jgi:hypothetical protein
MFHQNKSIDVHHDASEKFCWLRPTITFSSAIGEGMFFDTASAAKSEFPLGSARNHLYSGRIRG